MFIFCFETSKNKQGVRLGISSLLRKYFESTTIERTVNHPLEPPAARLISVSLCSDISLVEFICAAAPGDPRRITRHELAPFPFNNGLLSRANKKGSEEAHCSVRESVFAGLGRRGAHGRRRPRWMFWCLLFSRLNPKDPLRFWLINRQLMSRVQLIGAVNYLT